VPKIYKVAEIDATNQEFATTSFQSKPSTANYDYDDGDVHLESNELEDNGVSF
jgi:hypothetical protein